jgi:Rieske Fe-S protein
MERVIEDNNDLSRRGFFTVATGVAVACMSLPVLQEIASAADAAPSTGGIDVGPLSDYSQDVISDKFASKDPAKKKEALIVVRKGDKLYASSGLCTHKGCVVQTQGDQIFCKCHNSVFNAAGVPQKGPAKTPLVRYAVSVNDQKHVIVDMSKPFQQADWEADGSFVKMT